MMTKSEPCSLWAAVAHLCFVRPETSWKIHGDKNYDGSPRPERYGLLMMLAEKRSGKWMVVVAQNTDAMPGPAPEEGGITSPISG